MSWLIISGRDIRVRLQVLSTVFKLKVVVLKVVKREVRRSMANVLAEMKRIRKDAKVLNLLCLGQLLVDNRTIRHMSKLGIRRGGCRVALPSDGSVTCTTSFEA